MWSEQPLEGLSPFEVQYLQNQPCLPIEDGYSTEPPLFITPDFPISNDYSMADSFALKEEVPDIKQLHKYMPMPMYAPSVPPYISQEMFNANANSAMPRRKRALLIGITYQNEPSQKPLPGVVESK